MKTIPRHIHKRPSSSEHGHGHGDAACDAKRAKPTTVEVTCVFLDGRDPVVVHAPVGEPLVLHAKPKGALFTEWPYSKHSYNVVHQDKEDVHVYRPYVDQSFVPNASHVHTGVRLTILLLTDSVSQQIESYKTRRIQPTPSPLPATITDEDVAYAAVYQHWRHVQSFSHELQDDFHLVSIAVQKSGNALLFASDRLKDNEKLVRLAVQGDGFTALKHASDRLKDNEGIVRLAVKNDGLALMLVSDRLKDNEDIVRLAVQKSFNAINYASNRVRVLMTTRNN